MVMFKIDDFRIIPDRTQIDFDPDKEEANRKCHKYSLTCAVDILEASALFQQAFITIDRIMQDGEVRHIHLAEYQNRIVQFVTTMRENETIRVISMRDAHKKEREIFKQNPPGFLV